MSKDDHRGRAQVHGPWTELARAKARIIEPLLGKRPLPADALAEACRAGGELVGNDAGEVSHQTIRNWIEAYEQRGMDGLERKPRATRGQTTLHPDLAETINGLLLNPRKYSVAEVHRQAKKYGCMVLKLDQADLPSYDQVRFVAAQISADERLFAHEGTRAYRSARETHVRFEAAHTNAIWQIDHHELDILAINPETGQPARPWLTSVQDDYSRAVCGYHLSFDYPNSTSIALALRHAMLPKPQDWWVMHGIPILLYMDNGWDFLSQHVSDFCLHLGIRCQSHEGYHPQAKGKIERRFRTLEEMCIHFLEGSVGSSPQKRPHKVTPSLSLDDVRKHIEDHFRDMHDTQHGTTKMKPRVRWADDPTVIRPVGNHDDLDFLLLGKDRVVRKDGIHFNNDIYLDREGVLRKYIGKRVTIRFDPRDLASVRVRCRDGAADRYVCTALSQTLTESRLDARTVRENNKRDLTALRKTVRAKQKRGHDALATLAAAEQMDTVREETTTPVAPTNGTVADDTYEASSETEDSQAVGVSDVSQHRRQDTNYEAYRRRLRYRYGNESVSDGTSADDE